MEFALVLVPLLTIVFGVISYGYMLSFRQAMSQGAAEGARAAAVWTSAYDATQQTARTAAGRTQVDAALASYGTSCASSHATCSFVYVPCGSRQCVAVTVGYRYSDGPLLPQLPFVPLPDLSYTAEVRVN